MPPIHIAFALIALVVIPVVGLFTALMLFRAAERIDPGWDPVDWEEFTRQSCTQHADRACRHA